MANYMEQCRACGRYCDTAPCYDCLWKENKRLWGALWLAGIRLEILTGRIRACHEETGAHELLDEAEMFCYEAKQALEGGEK